MKYFYFTLSIIYLLSSIYYLLFVFYIVSYMEYTECNVKHYYYVLILYHKKFSSRKVKLIIFSG